MPVRVTQSAVEVLRAGDPSVRVTQVSVEILRQSVAGAAHVAITQAAIEVLRQNPLPSVLTVSDDLGLVADVVSGALTSILGDAALDPLSITDFVSATIYHALTSSIVDSISAIQDIVSGSLHHTRYASVIDSLSLSDSTDAGSISLNSRSGWIAPIDITPAAGLIDPVHIAAHPIRHPSKFYEPRVKSYGQFTRSIGVPVGFVRTGDCQLSIVDADNGFRQAISPKTIINGRAEVRLGPEGGPLSAFLRPFIRSVSAVDQPGDGEIRITLRDFITQSFEQQIPPLVTKDNFPNLPEESNGAFAPIVLGNVSVQNYIANAHGDTFIGEFVSDVLKTVLSQYFTGPNPGGAIKAILVDPTAHTYLVARHPCRSVKAYKYSNATVGYIPAGLYTSYTQQIASGEVCQFIDLPYDPEGAEIRVNVEGQYAANAANAFIGFFGRAGSYIESIGMVYSQVDADEILTTEESGHDDGGTEFSDTSIPDGCRIAGIRIWNGDYIDALQLIYEDGEGNITYGTKHGGSGGTMSVFALPEDEYIVRISGKYGNYIDSLTITTNLRTSPKYGGTGGTWGTYDVALNPMNDINFSDAILNVLTAHLGVERSNDYINFASFAETKDRVSDLICAGAFTKAITWGEALTQLQRSSNIDLFCDRHDRLTVRYATDDDEPVVNLTDLTDLYGGSVRQSMAAPAFNRLPYRFMPNYADDTWEEKNWDNVGDQVASGAIMADEPLQLYFVRDPETALLVTERRGDFVDLDAFRFEGTVPLIPTVDKLELAQIVGIDHFGGMKAGGYVNEQFKITDLTLDIDNLAYNFKGIRRRLPTPPVVEGTLSGRTAENARNGPFSNLVDGEMFAVFKHATLNRMTVQRTTDYGANWTEADADNAPAIAATGIGSFDAVEVDGNIHIATQEITSGRVKHHVFSMGLREWTTVDEVVVASLSNPSDWGVSIEWRYPDKKIFIMFQGDRVQVSGTWWDRGYYTSLESGTWATPVILSVPHADRGYVIERVVSGRNNRMHFLLREDRNQWAVTASEGGTQSSVLLSSGNFSYYYCHRNLGGWAINEDRTKIVIPRRGGVMMGRICVSDEGFPLGQHAIGSSPSEFIPYFYLYNSNPAIFAASDAEDPATIYAAFADSWLNKIQSMPLGTDYMYATGTELQAGPSGEMGGNNTNGLVGNIFTERGRKYLCYLFGQHVPERWTSRWLRIDRLPYTG